MYCKEDTQRSGSGRERIGGLTARERRLVVDLIVACRVREDGRVEDAVRGLKGRTIEKVRAATERANAKRGADWKGFLVCCDDGLFSLTSQGI